jgi:hypothetical protein
MVNPNSLSFWDNRLFDNMLLCYVCLYCDVLSKFMSAFLCAPKQLTIVALVVFFLQKDGKARKKKKLRTT